MWGTNEEFFVQLFGHVGFPQLQAIFEQYRHISGKTMEQAVQSEITGDLKVAIITIGNIYHFITFRQDSSFVSRAFNETYSVQ